MGWYVESPEGEIAFVVGPIEQGAFGWNKPSKRDPFPGTCFFDYFDAQDLRDAAAHYTASNFPNLAYGYVRKHGSVRNAYKVVRGPDKVGPRAKKKGSR